MSVSAARHKITGICPPARGACIAEVMRARPAPVWLVAASDTRAAEQLAEDIALFSGVPPGHILVFPESIPDSRDMREAFAASTDRLNVLGRLRRAAAEVGGGRLEVGGGRLEDSDFEPPTFHPPPPASNLPPPTSLLPPPTSPLVIVTTPPALLQPVPALEKFAAAELILIRGQKQPFQGLLEQLRALDYDSEALCEAPGQYAVRGGIVDIYPVTATQPYRLDFFGDEIEDIRAFDPVTQRSEGEPVPRVALAASPRVGFDPAKGGLADYLLPGSALILVEPSALLEEFRAFAEDASAGLEPLLAACASATGIAELDEADTVFESGAAEETWDTESLSHHRRYPGEDLLAQDRLAAEEEARGRFLRQVAAWKAAGFDVLFVASKEGEEKRMREILEADPVLKNLGARFLRGSLNEGFRMRHPGARLAQVVATETEVFGRQRPRRPKALGRATATRSQVDQLLDFSELVEGDFVVHLQHGIALFRGLTKLDTAQGLREVISLEFDDRVTLHVPLSESHLISRYVGLSKTRPQLGRIGSGRWEKARQAAERATLDLAAELLQIQARREAQPGFAFPPDDDWQREFEASFPFTETRDQARAIVETKLDMERTRPMDRLICGDVGFGKTEVALRAAFKAVQGGRQVAILVPTTVLAQQHLNTFRERMAGYPISVEMLSRFRTPQEQKKLLAAAAAGTVDILIGTHRLIQRDVAFKDLGLVVIDEEQRFGVKHKEVFKRMRETVDVLSMSATPIPRTLYLALTGARDLSVIETAPTDRHPILTVVKTYDDQVVVDAVRHEIRRGGQVFYLHNAVSTIEAVAARLATLVPGIAIGVGHEQMDAGRLERTMTDFVAGRYQVLVCTTIIESGLDIPNCNTIIIEGADRFGLSQLYQLRGRVGRFRNQAYAYLLLHKHRRLLGVARERLAAVRQHNQLGAGFRIAMRDLELRGSGNLLGPEQSGHIAGVGFELYCQLLRQSVARLKGDKGAAFIRASVKLDFVFVGEGARDGDASLGRRDDGYTALKEAEDREAGARAIPLIQARIPESYVGETRLRIDFYRRLALATDVPALRRIEEDFADRFGAIGPEVRALLLVTEIRILAEQKGLLSVESETSRLKCLRHSGHRDDWVMPGKRFPRLTARRPLLRLREIIAFLNRLPTP